MRSSLRLLAAVNALLLLSAFGCGDEGGSCGPAPEKTEEAPPAAAGPSGGSGGGSGAAELITSDKKGRVPKPYQRARSAYEPAKSTATISKPVIPAKSTAAVSKAEAALSPSLRRASSLPIATVVRRRVDGVIDRVEVACRILATSSDGSCAASANYDEIKARCCPNGLVERCRTTSIGVVLVGRGCEAGKP